MPNAVEQTQFKVQSHLAFLRALMWMDELCTDISSSDLACPYLLKTLSNNQSTLKLDHNNLTTAGVNQHGNPSSIVSAFSGCISTNTGPGSEVISHVAHHEFFMN